MGVSCGVGDEDIFFLEYEKGLFPSAAIPFGAVVTASGTGAEMNSGAVITYEEKLWKGPILASLATFAVLDPLYTATVAKRQVLSGAFDTLSHALETYLGASDFDNPSDDLSIAIIKNTVRNIRRIIVDIEDMEARGNLMWDSAMAENGILKLGRATDFQAHQIEHQLGSYTDCNHGEGLAVIQPVYYRHIIDDARYKFERLAKEVFGLKSAEDFLSSFEELRDDARLSKRLGDLKTKEPITKEMLRKIADTSNIIKSGPRVLTHDEIYEILLECM